MKSTRRVRVALRRALGAAVALSAAVAVMTVAPTAQALENQLALTPPMGWNSWNKYGCSVTEAKVKAEADAIVASGLKDAGYSYVTVDDCWMASSRDAVTGGLVADATKFPSGMKALGDYIHGKGLKFGIYESPTQGTCQHRPGSYGHETQDANTFASWGVDALKYDWCGDSTTESPQLYVDYPNSTPQALAQVLFPRMRDALAATNRPILYMLSACCAALDFPSWASGTANQWRISTDIYDNWNSIMNNFNRDTPHAASAGPGGWNDPDMLEVGNGGMTDAEDRTHFSLWAQLAAPLIMGHDVSTQSAATKTILGNTDVIAVDQDSKGAQGTVVNKKDGLLVMRKPLANGDLAVTLTNTTSATATISTSASVLGIGGVASYSLKDLWSKGTSTSTGAISASVASHATVMYRVTPNGTVPTPAPSPVSDQVTDTTTQGNWKGVYGGAGYRIPGDTTSLPAGIT
ncbi:glycoside hydrolase family 27 protein, partial [Kitasatospora sp. NPDC057015]|uniref:glycoside hydrolase family 27 protein n=1 Tax=Kitasatospora sp. NPDC057015 TaxID=3346001 RepID=UPI003638C6E2